MLAALLERALVVGTVLPLLSAFAVFEVVAPFASVFGAILVEIDPSAVRPIFYEVPLVDIPIEVVEGALAIGLALAPLPFIFGTVLPVLASVSMLNRGIPILENLTSVGSSIGEDQVFNSY